MAARTLKTLRTGFGSGATGLTDGNLKGRLDALGGERTLVYDTTGSPAGSGAFATKQLGNAVAASTLQIDARLRGQHGNVLFVETRRHVGGDAAQKVFDLMAYHTRKTLGVFTSDGATPATYAMSPATLRHGLKLGDPVRVTNSGGALPTNLSATAMYFVIPHATDKTKFQLATTKANAIAGTAVGQGAGTGVHSVHAMKVQVYTGSMLNAAANHIVKVVNGHSEFITVTDLGLDTSEDTDRPADTTTPVALAGGAGEVTLTGVVRGDVIASITNLTDEADVSLANVDIVDTDKIVGNVAFPTSKKYQIRVRPQALPAL